jgi:hypothetical protein
VPGFRAIGNAGVDRGPILLPFERPVLLYFSRRRPTDFCDRRRDMSIKTLLAALVLTVAPGLAIAECSFGRGHEVTMSCADGMTWDADAQACVPVVSS